MLSLAQVFSFEKKESNLDQDFINPMPQMGLEPTTLRESITDALTTELLETLW